MGRRQLGRRDDSGSWLATLLIVATGGGFCAFAAMAASPDALLIAATVGLCTIGLFVLVHLLNRSRQANSFGLGFLFASSRNRRDDGLKDYQPRKVASKSSAGSSGNQPITAGEAKELRLTSASTWIPSRGRKSGSSKDS
jgi:hypothetical protein